MKEYPVFVMLHSVCDFTNIEVSAVIKSVNIYFSHTHTHTHTHIYIYTTNTANYVEFYLLRRINLVYSLLEITLTLVYVHLVMPISGRNVQ
jgi:inner membrane protein involved in colicin E2 resistance